MFRGNRVANTTS